MASPACFTATLLRVMYKQSAASKEESSAMKRGDDDRDSDGDHDAGEPPTKRAKSASGAPSSDANVDPDPPTAGLSAFTPSILDIARTALKEDSALDAGVAAESSIAATTSATLKQNSDKLPLEEANVAAAEAAGLGEDDLEREAATVTFPERLMELLDQGVEKEALWWLDDGDGFCVLPRLFADRILNVYFQGTKFESFTRKLNRWGFKRAAGHHVPTNALAYYHTHFQRGKPQLLKNMKSGKKKEAFGLPPATTGSSLPAASIPPTAPHTAFAFPTGAGGPLSPSILSTASVSPLAFSGGTLLPSGGIYIPPHLVAAASSGSSPLEHDFQLHQSLLASSQQQQHAELALQQQRARILAAQLANEQASAELRRRALASTTALAAGSADFASAMMLAAVQAPAPLGTTPGSGGGAPTAQAYGAVDPILLQLLLERQRQPDGAPPR